MGARTGIGWRRFASIANLFECENCPGVVVAPEHRSRHDADVHGIIPAHPRPGPDF